MLMQAPQRILRSPVQSQLARMGTADIVAGIPCYNNQETIAHVVQTVSQGLAEHYPEHRSVLVVVDGSSQDESRTRACMAALPANQTELVTLSHGIHGKGSALRTLFAVALALEAKACLCVDADLRSITPDWVRFMLEPILLQGYEFIAPFYTRYKYDGTITNNLVYGLTRALFGQRIRQPIGGDFAFAGWLARHYFEQPVWDTDVARFGIDIWMTLQAIVAGARIGQTNLGVKLHDAKDPARALGPMFQQVCGTLFAQIDQHFDLWSRLHGSQPIPTFGRADVLEPEAIAIDHPRLVADFQHGFQMAQPVYQQLFSEPVFNVLQQASQAPPDTLSLPGPIWAKLLYELIATYHHLEGDRTWLIPYITPLYLGQVASFVNQTRELDVWAAEAVIESLARSLEQAKPYLLELWSPHPNRRRQIAALQQV
jgi:hypothetical protein